MKERLGIIIILSIILLSISQPVWGEFDEAALILRPLDLDMVFHSQGYLGSHRLKLQSFLEVGEIEIIMREEEPFGYDFTRYRGEEEQVLAFTDKGLTLQNRFELMEGVALIGSYRMEGSSSGGTDGVLFSRIASGEIAVNPDLFMNMGLSIHLIQADQDVVESSANRLAREEEEYFYLSYREDPIYGGNSIFDEAHFNQGLRTGIGVNIAPFDKTVVLADYILRKDDNDLSTRITSLGLEYEDEKNRLLAKYELAASEDNRRATAIAGVEVGIMPWASLMASFQWGNQKFYEEIMKESVLNLGVDIFLSDSTSLLLGYKFVDQGWNDVLEDLDPLKERSNVAGARLKFRF